METIIWQIEPIDYDLCVEWAISRRSDHQKRNYLVKMNKVVISEFAPNIHFGETHQKVEQQIESFNQISNNLTDLQTCLDFCEKERSQDNFCNSFLAGIELAALNYFEAFDSFFEHSAKKCKSSMSVPIISMKDFLSYFDQMNLAEFEVVKIKSNENLPLKIIEHILDNTNCSISIDYNEALRNLDVAVEHLSFLKRINRLKYIEQPFSAHDLGLYIDLKKVTNIPIFIDETITKQLPTRDLVKICDGINFKVMKSGGPLNTLAQIKKARELKLKCMLGCMVESSLSMSNYVKMSYLVDYCDLDGSLFLNEDPFKMITINNGNVVL